MCGWEDWSRGRWAAVVSSSRPRNFEDLHRTMQVWAVSPAAWEGVCGQVLTKGLDVLSRGADVRQVKGGGFALH